MKQALRTPANTVLDPVSEQQRINSVDVLRGVALLGILLLNIVGMALPDPAYWDPSGYGGDTGWNLRVFFLNDVFIEGTMRAVFSMLFGAGVILFTARKEDEGAGPELADAWYRRVIWLVVFGLIHAYVLIWPGEVLYFYGIVGMFIFPARHASPRRLIGFCLFLVLVITALNIYDANKVSRMHEQAMEAQAIADSGGTLNEDQEASLQEWDYKVSEYKLDEETKERVVEQMRSGYFSAVKTMAPISQFIQTTYFFRHGFLDVLSMMLLGMGLFKLRVFHGELSWKVYTLFVLIGYGVGIPVNWHETASYVAEHFSVVRYYSNMQTYELGRIFTTLGHVGLVMLFTKAPVLGFLKRALAAVGRMALTNYIMHTVIATTLFGIFRQFGQWQRYELYYLVLAIWIFQLVASPLWLRYFRFGPLEWIWRWLTYGKRPRFMKSS
jgi:uncharacterized protein